MARTDYIHTQQDVIDNIATLYSYLDNAQGDDYKQWAVGMLKRGHNMVIEIIDNHICLGPSRFVGYLNNTKDVHRLDQGNGTDTDRQIKPFYELVEDDRLDKVMQEVLAHFGTQSAAKKYWIPKQYTVEDILKFPPQLEGANNMNHFVSKAAQLLLYKHNIILQGAPGTGKTYNTAAIALKAMGIDDIDLDDHAAVMSRYRSLQDASIFFTTFHQSLDYEDFVEGLKPHVLHDDKGNAVGVTYEPEDGILKRACQAALDAPDTPVILIIDEINRGNVSKIFGELITLLEADKRLDGTHPIQVTLPYSKELFGIPSNFYIIGTMNTTDRSVGTLDYALRRRFAFITLKADETIITKYYQDLGNEDLGATAVTLFRDIKAFIEDPNHISGDTDIDDLMIGHSYLMAKDEEELHDKVEYEVLPLLAEYINDGIINVTSEEKKTAFSYWSDLSPIPSDETEDADDVDDDE